MTVTVFGYLILISIDFYVFSLVLVSIEKIYQTLKIVFDHISKHLDVCQKYSAARRISNSLLGVWKCGQSRSFVFGILLQICPFLMRSLAYSPLLRAYYELAKWPAASELESSVG